MNIDSKTSLVYILFRFNYLASVNISTKGILISKMKSEKINYVNLNIKVIIVESKLSTITQK